MSYKHTWIFGKAIFKNKYIRRYYGFQNSEGRKPFEK